MFIANRTTTSKPVITVTSLRRLRSFYRKSIVEPINNTPWNDTQLVKQDTTTTKSLISNNSRVTPTPDSSLLSTSPAEIQRQLKAWRDHQERLHIIV